MNKRVMKVIIRKIQNGQIDPEHYRRFEGTAKAKAQKGLQQIGFKYNKQDDKIIFVNLKRAGKALYSIKANQQIKNILGGEIEPYIISAIEKREKDPKIKERKKEEIRKTPNIILAKHYGRPYYTQAIPKAKAIINKYYAPKFTSYMRKHWLADEMVKKIKPKKLDVIIRGIPETVSGTELTLLEEKGMSPEEDMEGEKLLVDKGEDFIEPKRERAIEEKGKVSDETIKAKKLKERQEYDKEAKDARAAHILNQRMRNNVSGWRKCIIATMETIGISEIEEPIGKEEDIAKISWVPTDVRNIKKIQVYINDLSEDFKDAILETARLAGNAVPSLTKKTAPINGIFSLHNITGFFIEIFCPGQTAMRSNFNNLVRGRKKPERRYYSESVNTLQLYNEIVNRDRENNNLIERYIDTFYGGRFYDKSKDKYRLSGHRGFRGKFVEKFGPLIGRAKNRGAAYRMVINRMNQEINAEQRRVRSEKLFKLKKR